MGSTEIEIGSEGKREGRKGPRIEDANLSRLPKNPWKSSRANSAKKAVPTSKISCLPRLSPYATMKIIVGNPKARDDNVNEVFEGRIGEMFAHGLAQKMGGVMITQIGKRRMKMSEPSKSNFWPCSFS